MSVFAIPDDSVLAIRHPMKHSTLTEGDFMVGYLEHADFGDIDQVYEGGNRALFMSDERVTWFEEKSRVAST